MTVGDMTILHLSAMLEDKLGFNDPRDLINTIPFIELKPGWMIQVIFPFCGAAARFIVKLKSNEGCYVSVYLDTTCTLGTFRDDDGKLIPHWEVYPDADGDNARFAMADANGLLAAIDASLVSQLSTKTPSTNEAAAEGESK